MGRTTTTQAGIEQRGGHWTEAVARDVFAELKASGETPAEFARRKGITRQRLSYWTKRLAPLALRRPPGEAGVRAPEMKFVAVALPAPLPASSGWVEVAVGGAVVRIREALDVEHVARLVEAITRRSGRPC